MKTIKFLLILILCIFGAWLLLSFTEIISKNIFGGATYSDYNIITNALHYLKIQW